MSKVKFIGMLAVAALVGSSVVSVAAANAKGIETIVDTESDGIMSYMDGNGNIWCSENNGKTWLSESDYEKENPVSAIEWWTYDEYKIWAEQEKAEMQKMVDEKAVVETSEGTVVWTQKMTDEIVTQNNQILEDIKNGVLVSKSVSGDSEGMASYNPNDITTIGD
ncbi:MAG: hypothetical protein HFI74_07050 [Lachnospiraceae bacterium]|jgi:hypothetical protein|nr:hypothetical protein [Lachnospiraceae bacterium]